MVNVIKPMYSSQKQNLVLPLTSMDICTYHVFGLLLQTAVWYNVYLCTCMPQGSPISPTQSREGKSETQLHAIRVCMVHQNYYVIKFSEI